MGLPFEENEGPDLGDDSWEAGPTAQAGRRRRKSSASRAPRVTAADVQAEADDLAVMWGGDEAALARAATWKADRLQALGLASGSVSEVSGSAEPALGGALSGEASSDLFFVHPDNVAAAQMFLNLSTQWRVSIMGGGLVGSVRVREGLDYTALPVVAGALQLALDRALLDGVRVLEAETLRLERLNLEQVSQKRRDNARNRPDSRGPGRQQKRVNRS